MKLKKIKEVVIVLAVIVTIALQASCYNHKSNPGWEYMPDMVHAVTYETYSTNDFYGDSMSSRMPVTGTIPRGVYQPFHFSPNPTGYDSAGLMLHFPAWLDSNALADGTHLFSIYCAVCHGPGGSGNGSIVTSTKIKNPFPPPPSYFDDAHINLPEGKMYYSVHYGKNLMGPYSKVLDHDQVWKVVYYVKSLQNHYNDSIVTAATKTAATASADTTNKK